LVKPQDQMAGVCSVLLVPLLIADTVRALSSGAPAFITSPACRGPASARGKGLSRPRATPDELNDRLGDFPAYNNVSAPPGGASPLILASELARPGTIRFRRCPPALAGWASVLARAGICVNTCRRHRQEETTPAAAPRRSENRAGAATSMHTPSLTACGRGSRCLHSDLKT